MDKAKDFEKGWKEHKAKCNQEIKEMISVIQNAVGGCATYWASLIAEEVLKYYQPKIPKNAVVLTREEHEKLTTPTLFIKTKSLSKKELDKKLKGMSKYGIIGVDESTIEIIPTRAEIEKETAEKFAEKLKERFPIDEDVFRFSTPEQIHKAIDEICKEFTEGKV